MKPEPTMPDREYPRVDAPRCAEIRDSADGARGEREEADAEECHHGSEHLSRGGDRVHVAVPDRGECGDGPPHRREDGAEVFGLCGVLEVVDGCRRHQEQDGGDEGGDAELRALVAEHCENASEGAEGALEAEERDDAESADERDAAHPVVLLKDQVKGERRDRCEVDDRERRRRVREPPAQASVPAAAGDGSSRRLNAGPEACRVLGDEDEEGEELEGHVADAEGRALPCTDVRVRVDDDQHDVGDDESYEEGLEAAGRGVGAAQDEVRRLAGAHARVTKHVRLATIGLGLRET
mmetsp:Transcript_27379/g.81779  ORF Transcript_27379/g.81779 Transcript_27379/m.81779 type:complete len:295 (-) Transcript_27379:165-1049(-)